MFLTSNLTSKEKYILLGVTVFLLIVLVIYLIHIQKQGIVKNPPSSYWFARSDAGGSETFDTDGVYLRQVINPPAPIGDCSSTSKCSGDAGCIDGKCVPYTNSEIYNSPCCSDETIKQACKSWISDKANQQAFSDFCGKNPELCRNFDFSNLQNIEVQLCNLFRSICGGPLSESIPENLKNHCRLIHNPIGVDSDIFTGLKELFFNTPYQYSRIKMKVRATNLKDGSRGWGFWNTNMFPMATIWFLQQDGVCPPGLGKECPEGPYPLNGFYIMIYDPDTKGVTMKKIPDLDENWHTYEIDWKSDRIIFRIDNKIVYTETKVIPSTFMAFHFWVDNAVFAPWHVLQNMTKPRTQELAWIEIQK